MVNFTDFLITYANESVIGQKEIIKKLIDEAYENGRQFGIEESAQVAEFYEDVFNQFSGSSQTFFSQYGRSSKTIRDLK